MRTIKTAIAVMVCVVVFTYIDEYNPFYAVIAAVICLKDTVENTIRIGVSRLIGTAVGGMFGILLLFVNNSTLNGNLYVLWLGIGIILAIYFCIIIKQPSACAIACVVLVAVMIGHKESDPYGYAFQRIVETFAGIVVAVLVNHFIRPVKQDHSFEYKPPKGTIQISVDDEEDKE